MPDHSLFVHDLGRQRLVRDADEYQLMRTAMKGDRSSFEHSAAPLSVFDTLSTLQGSARGWTRTCLPPARSILFVEVYSALRE